MSIRLIITIIIILSSLSPSTFAYCDRYCVFDSNRWAKPLKSFSSPMYIHNYGDSVSFMYGYKKYEIYDAHGGMDINGRKGDDVFAIDDGVVKRIDKSSAAINNMSIIYIEHKTSSGTKFLALYGHVYAAYNLNVGSRITKNSRIGSLTEYEVSKSAYLHLGISYNLDDYKNTAWGGISGGITDPVSFLNNNSAGESDDYYGDTAKESSIQCPVTTLAVFDVVQCKLSVRYTGGISLNITDSKNVTWGLSDSDAAKINYSGLVTAKGVMSDTPIYVMAKYVENGLSFENKLALKIIGLQGQLASKYGCDKDQKVIARKNIDSGAIELLSSNNCGTRWARTIAKDSYARSQINISAYSKGRDFSANGYGNIASPMVFDYRACTWGKIGDYSVINYTMCQ